MADAVTSRPAAHRAALLAPVATLLASARGRMAVVAAPAGFGKSTQVAAWAAQDGRAVGWIHVEPADDDPAHLAATVLSCLRAGHGGVPGDIPEPPRSAEPAELLSVVRRAAQACTTPCILVLDDVHLLGSRGALDVVDVLASNIPASSTLVLVSRAAPSAALARVRVHRGAVDVTAADLALDVPHAARLLAELGVTLDDGAVELLVQETEGWPVGVRLAGLALLAEPDPGRRRLEDLVRHDHETADYVHQEWLGGLSAEDVDLLTRVAFLDRLSGPLCDHVLEGTGTAAVLERLHGSGLVVAPLDRRHESYRMHRALRAVLEDDLARADPAAARRGHERASGWFESQGDVDLALHHALAAGDLDRAEGLVEAHTVAFQVRGRHATITRWLDSFPEGHVTSRPSLCLLAAAAALADAERDGTEVTAWLRTGEEVLARTPDSDPSIALRYDAFRALVGTLPVAEATAAARRALDGLPPGIWHSLACLAHGAQSFAAGDDQLAEQLLAEAAAEAAVHGAVTVVAVSQAHLALLQSAAGDWSRAAPKVRTARALVEDHRLHQYPTMVLVTAMAALLEAVEGNPDQARDEWRLTRRQLQHMGGVAPWANVQARLALARTSLLLSDRSAARTLMEEAESLVLAQPDALRPKAQLAELEELMGTSSTRRSTAYALTTAELRVLHHLPTNLTLSEIADRLYVSRNTAKSHAASIYRKLGTKRRGETVKLAEAVGLLPSSDGPLGADPSDLR